MTSLNVNLKKILTLTLIFITVAVFSTTFLIPAVHAEGGSGGSNPPPHYTDTTIISSTGEDPTIIEETSTEAVSFSLWDTIITAVDALI